MARLPRDRASYDSTAGSVDQLAAQRAVAELPERQRNVLVARYFLDWSVETTSRELGMSADAVRSLSKRAVAGLRTQLDAAAQQASQESRHG